MAALMIQPKFEVGQTVWFVDTKRVDKSWPCPDCLGTKQWRVETPAGQAYDITCQRCAGGFVYQRQDDVVSLNYIVWEPAPRSRTIGRIEIDTRGHFGEGPEVRYDGHREDGLYETEEQALAASKARVAVMNADERRKPEVLAARNIGKLVLDKALTDQFGNGLWNAWYAYNSLVEAVEGWIGDDKESLSKSDLEAMRSDLRWNVEYRDSQDRPLDALVAAVRAALTGDVTGLQAAYEALPSPLRRAPSSPSSPGVS